MGLCGDVVVLDISLPRLRYLDDVFNGQIKTVYANSYNIASEVLQADLLIGAVLITGHKAPCLVNRGLVKRMKKEAAIIDVAVDQGGCIETKRVTTHSDPIYYVGGVLHYGAANMPGSVPRTSTLALTNATLPYLLKIADMGFRDALIGDPGFLRGLNITQGKVTHPAVAQAREETYTPPEELL